MIKRPVSKVKKSYFPALWQHRTGVSCRICVTTISQRQNTCRPRQCDLRRTCQQWQHFLYWTKAFGHHVQATRYPRSVQKPPGAKAAQLYKSTAPRRCKRRDCISDVQRHISSKLTVIGSAQLRLLFFVFRCLFLQSLSVPMVPAETFHPHWWTHCFALWAATMPLSTTGLFWDAMVLARTGPPAHSWDPASDRTVDRVDFLGPRGRVRQWRK